MRSYRAQSGLDYPINIARNVARAAAVTEFVLPADIELYPRSCPHPLPTGLSTFTFSPDLIPEFLSMIHRVGGPQPGASPRVYVLNVFEISGGHDLPTNKSQLASLLQAGAVVPFHQAVCPQCHNTPRQVTPRLGREKTTFVTGMRLVFEIA